MIERIGAESANCVADDSAPLADRFGRLQRLIDRHFADLTRYGLLPAEAITEAIHALGTKPYMFAVRSHGREVGFLRRAEGAEALISEDTEEVHYQNCHIVISNGAGRDEVRAVRVLLRHCQFIFLNTIVWKNLQKRRHRELYEKLRLKVAENDENIRIETLPRLIKDELGIKVEIVERVRLPTDVKRAGKIHFVRRGLGRRKTREGAKQITDPFLVRLIQREALDRATTLDVTSYLRPNSDRRDPVVVIPLCRSSAPRASRSQLFLLRGTKSRPLTQEDITAVEAVVTFFLEEVLYNRQRDYILSMLGEIALAGVGRIDDIEEQWSRVLQQSLARIVTDTTAYRCSYWQLDQKHSVIRPERMATYERGKLQTRFQVAETRIKPTQLHGSSIAYVMAGAEGEGYLIVNDCNNPKSDLSGKMIRSIIKPSGETQSEMAVQMREHAVPFGVILAESRLDHGFDSDKWYIRAVAALLSEYRRTLFQRLDSSYVAERLSLFDSSHDLDVFIDVNLKEVPEIADRLRSVLRLGLHDREEESEAREFEISDIIESIKEDYVARSRLVREAVFGRIHLDNVPPMLGTRQFERAVGYILKNLISNAFRYEEQSKTTIGIRVEAKSMSWVGVADRYKGAWGDIQIGAVLRIDCVITPPIIDAIETQIGKRSVLNATRGGRRGLYLVGLIVRQLAGGFEVHRTPDNRRTKLVIRIPVEILRRYG